MPELPEVETICRQLNDKLKGHVIECVTILQSGREKPAGQKLIDILRRKKIESVKRRAKLIVWHFSDGTALVTHLKMTGSQILVDKKYIPKKHDRMVFEIGPHCLVWADIRKFGHINYLDSKEFADLLVKYGPEPLTLKPEEIAKLFIKPKTRNIKSALLNQQVIAGIGNIYADESLFRAGIKPTRRLGSLSAQDRMNLAKAIQEVLKEAIKYKGTSAQNCYDANGQKGSFVQRLNVYGRKNQPCKKCGAPITRIVVAQRGTHYCPKCQK